MDLALTLLAVSFAVSFTVVKLLKPIAYNLELVDKPGGRKLHNGSIPLIGGVAIYISVLFTAYIFLEQPLFIRFFLLSGGLIVMVGLLDDRYDISARARLAFQTLVAAIFVYGLDVYIVSFGNLFGFGDIHAAWLGYPLTILSLIGIMNAINMLDGMDGLVGSLIAVCFIGLVGLFGLAGQTNYQLLCLIFIGAIAAFLLFNIWGRPSNKSIKKVFMGDAGSMFLGLSLGVLLVRGVQPDVGALKPITALWFVLLPMTDMFTIMYRRLKRGRSPMAADRTHIHHILIRAGFSKYQTLHIMLIAQASFVTIGIALELFVVPEWVSFVLAVVMVLSYQYLMRHAWRFIRWSKRRLLLAS